MYGYNIMLADLHHPLCIPSVQSYLVIQSLTQKGYPHTDRVQSLTQKGYPHTDRVQSLTQKGYPHTDRVQSLTQKGYPQNSRRARGGTGYFCRTVFSIWSSFSCMSLRYCAFGAPKYPNSFRVGRRVLLIP